ncbi:leucyl-tRNA synthetase [Lojkania enalia]|uniref:leucine--tRNA ligase n=1 Tax=Lojkania enalia TaxID=147567 RepID=A0A9P4K6X6_9PLEO|nr:leucyl-tRNA synthetase [Didymosphaeria enalia]
MRGLRLHPVGWRRALLPQPPQSCSFPKLFSSISQKLRSEKENALFPQIDAKWRARWEAEEAKWHRFQPADKRNAYILPMFPYPSGVLHLGHLRVYTISDVLARFKKMQGYEVIHPIGWDAFGLPAENAAIERGIHPETWTLQNIEKMKEQMKAMGGHWDWHREIRTCDPEYYKHNQRIFLMLYERGLAYQAESLVNYDPVDKTVLANEQVDANGCSWRSGAKVEKLMLKQWFLKISEFRKELLYDMDKLAENGNWPERVLAMQRNWLGRSEGVNLSFDVMHAERRNLLAPIEVFTTRADTLFAVQYVALSLNHPIIKEAAKEDKSLCGFLERAKDLPPDSKEGHLLENVTVKNPASNFVDDFDIHAQIPVYVAPYVLDYGSGAVMGVPGHDFRDHAFWRANAGDRPIRQCITSKPDELCTQLVYGSEQDRPMVEKGFVATHINGVLHLPSDQAVDEIVKLLQKKGVKAQKTENWRLRDWLISRQRYWGTPIPIIHCHSCGPVPVPVEDLPVQLPRLPDAFFHGKAGNPLAEDAKWKKTICPKCGSAAKRETDTMDTFMDSSWYFFRFLDPQNKESPVSPTNSCRMPVDVYVGGVEHAILHLLYARFISKFLAMTGLWPSGSGVNGEPFKKLITQGMVHGKTYSDPATGRFLRPEEVDLTEPSKPVIKSTGVTPNISFEKMSKSKYNGVDPGATISKYGADVTRAHMLFQAPISDVLEWDESSITGIQRWLGRVLRLCNAIFINGHGMKHFKPPSLLDQPLLDLLRELRERNILKPAQAVNLHLGPVLGSDEELVAALKPSEQTFWSKVQEIISSVTQSYSETYSLNTVVSDLMTLTNLIIQTSHTSDALSYLKFSATTHLLRMLAPIAPAVAEEGWEKLHEITTANFKHERLIYSDYPCNILGSHSIFNYGFPQGELAILPKLNPTQQCVFMVHGKKKFEVEIGKAPLSIPNRTNEGKYGESMKLVNWTIEQLLETEKGKEWLAMGEGTLWKISGTEEPSNIWPLLPKDWDIVVVKSGRLVNVTGPKKKESDKESSQ